MPGEVPEGWHRRSIASATSALTSGYWGSELGSDGTSPCCVIRNGDVLDTWEVSHELPTRGFTQKEIAKARVQSGDVILVSSGNTGRVGLVTSVVATQPTVASNFVRLLRPNPSVAHGVFLYYALQTRSIQAALDGFSGGTTIRNLQSAAYDAVQVVLPPLPEQKKIAAILASVDEAIRATQAVIDQTRRVKEGLLQDLLTRGIGYTRFKHTEIGEIPESWEVRPVSECFPDTGDGNYSAKYPRQSEFVAEGVPFITPSDIEDYRISDQRLRFISRAQHAELTKGHLREGDVLMVTRGNTGQLAEVDARFVGANMNAQLVRLGLRDSLFVPGFALVVLDAPFTRLQIAKGQSGSALGQLPWRHLNRVLLPVPPKDEQVRLRDAFVGLRGGAAIEARSALARLATVKGGLLQDLLTGKVRVAA
jgi:type I restriction enzyme S subunit